MDDIPCPGCGETNEWLMERTIQSTDQFTVVEDGAGGLVYDLGAQRDADWTMTSARCSNCGWSVEGDWNEFIKKVTLPDPAALLALRDRAAKED